LLDDSVKTAWLSAHVGIFAHLAVAVCDTGQCCVGCHASGGCLWATIDA
jgi:hypothetical protein